MDTFKALVASAEEGKVNASVQELRKEDLPEGDVLIRVHYSSVNFKDGLAATNAKSGVVRNYPMVLGIDLSGEVVESKSEEFQPGDKVIATSYGLGVSHPGGFSEYAQVPVEWVVPLPEGLDLKEAMILGTAGFTAGESVVALEEKGLHPEKGPVLVRGTTGGVGSTSVQILDKLGYTVAAESRKKETSSDYLRQLGADEVLHPDEAQLEKRKPLAKQRWQAIIDPVGGEYLSDYLAQLQYGGSLALSGNAGGVKFEATVLPFILRGINVLGIDSVDYPLEKRRELWHRLATDMKPANLAGMVDHEVSLEELPSAFEQIMAGKMKGRILVKVAGE